MPQPLRIGRYEIKSPIGGGGMGTLYLARDTNPTTDRLVALKLLKANLDSGDLRARFAREAQSLARLNHPNIVNIYDSGEFRGRPYIVMEYVRGETLSEKLKRKASLSLGQKLRLLVELCSGLAHSHEAGIIHRDIKPANLLVDQQGRLKIVDFGIARVADTLTRVAIHVTQLNMQIGTPGYMSPEQIEGNEVDARSDLFAVGAVAYELLTGHEAFPGANTKQIERKVLQSQPPAIVTMVHGLDPAIAAIVNRALEKDPNQRYQDAQSMEEALQNQRMRLGPAETPVPPRVTPQPGAARARGSRADVAYRHAVAMINEGAPETARRHLLEALAEDSEHPEAKALLSEVEGGTPRVEPAVLSDILGQSGDQVPEQRTDYLSRRDDFPGSDAGYLDPTVVIRPKSKTVPPARKPHPDIQRRADDSLPQERTDYAPRRDDFGDRVASPQDPTVVIRPKTTTTRPARRPSSPKPQWGANSAVWDPREWSPRTRLLAVAVPLALLAVAGGLVFWRPWDTGYLLTVTKPEGGTITATGIACGADGTTCVASFSNSEMLELEAHPKEGFTFAGFTGDCAPGGRTMMNAPRECGARFERIGVVNVVEGDVLLTIAPPSGGTIVGRGVLCGSHGKECSGKFSMGFEVQLEGQADEGYVLQGFSGDCSSDGKAIMIGPRTCGATFVGGNPGKLTVGSNGNQGSTPSRPVTPGGGSRGSGPGTGVSGSSSGAGPGTGDGTGTGTGPAGAGGGPIAGGGGVSGGPSGAPPGVSAEDPNKPVREVTTRDAASRANIAETLKQYLAAYGHLDYEELQRAYPTAPRAIRLQLDQYNSMEYSFGGPPRFLKFDPDAGSALIELDFKQVAKVKVGPDQKNEGRVTFQLHRLQNEDWVIDLAQFKGKK